MKLIVGRPKSSRTIELDVEPDETIENVKAKVRDKEGIQRVDLSCNKITLVDWRTLSYYNIRSEHVLLLGFTIFLLMPFGEQGLVYVEASDTIATVKTIIQNQEAIPSDHQHLRFDDRELENERTFADCNIQPEAVLFLDIHECMDDRCAFCHLLRGSDSD